MTARWAGICVVATAPATEVGLCSSEGRTLLSDQGYCLCDLMAPSLLLGEKMGISLATCSFIQPYVLGCLLLAAPVLRPGGSVVNKTGTVPTLM